MNIFMHEFKMSIRSVITWSIALFCLIFVFMSMFNAFASDAELLNEMMSQFPEELLMAFGMTNIDMATVLGFYSLIFTFIQICIAIQAANYGFSLVSVEERDMTADFLLAKPVGRTKILTMKGLSAITGLTLTNLIVWASSFVFINVYRDGRPYEIKTLLLLLLSIVMFQFVFMTVGLLISLLVRRIRNVTPYSMGLAFGTYVLNAFGGMLGEEKLELITPFKHFDPNYIINNASFDFPMMFISLSFIIVSIIASYVLYTRRNIPSAV